MAITNLCGLLPSSAYKKTLRQRVLETLGRIWFFFVEAKAQLSKIPKVARIELDSVTGFRARFSSLVGIALAATIYNITPYGLFKLISAITFLFFSEALVLTSFPGFYSGTIVWFRTIIRLRRGKGVEWKPLTEGMREISDNMGVKIEKVGVMEGLHNAFSLPLFKTIIIGRPLYDSLSEKSLEAVFAHELAHVKERHNFVPILALPIIMSQLTFWMTLPVQLFVIAGFAFFRLALIPFNWLVEIRADAVAGRFVGNDSMIDALKSLGGVKIDEPSESHPSRSRRISRLEKGPMSRFRYILLGSLLVVGALLPWLIGLLR
jgi:Zn-dependent protease with chaperone function